LNLAKPTLSISIEEHTQHVKDEVREILAPRTFMQNKYKKFFNKDLKKRVMTAAKYHDVGKGNPRWQIACKKDNQIFLETGEQKKMYHLRNAKFRHEIGSLLTKGLENLSDPVKAAIGSHHGKLSEGEHHRWENEIPEAKELFAHFKGLKNEILYKTPDHEKFEKAILSRYEYSGPRALLQFADHRASSREEGNAPLQIKYFNYNFPIEYSSKRGVQLIIDDLKNEPFSILRAPTGSGKTDASLLWAKHQIDSNKADRLIIAMPTRFTANALSIAAAEKLSQIGLYHSSAWFQKLTSDSLESGISKRTIDQELQLARLLETPISVTTIDHLLIALTGTREDQHSIFFNIANSCIVIDEADFYDEFTQYNILVLLKVLRILKVPILLMSATVPDSVIEFYNKSGFIIEKIFEDVTDSKRLRCGIKRVDDLEISKELQQVMKKGIDGTPLIVYANTVDRANNYYEWFIKNSPSLNIDNIVMYHSRFTEPDKVLIEKKLTSLLGKDAWDQGAQKGIAILTQIGELSVNISSDLMISDLCPIDRLVQRAGRLSRFNKNIGELFIVKPMKKKKDGSYEYYCAPYGIFEKKKWIMSKVLEDTNSLLIENKYSAEDFVNLVKLIYPDHKTNTSPNIQNNYEELIKMIKSNWLILPSQKMEEHDEELTEWKSRNIEQQMTVFVNVNLFENECYFNNYSEYQLFKIYHGVQCSIWEFQKALKKGLIEKVTFYIGYENKQYLFVINERYYNPVTGLNLNRIIND